MSRDTRRTMERFFLLSDPTNKPLWNVTFHEQHSSGYGFPSLLLATRASADVSELVFKHEWRSHEYLKTIPTHPLRHTWPEVVMENHTRSSAVHGKSHTNSFVP